MYLWFPELRRSFHNHFYFPSPKPVVIVININMTVKLSTPLFGPSGCVRAMRCDPPNRDRTERHPRRQEVCG